MPAGLLIRLRPTGPWRIGPDSGDRDRVDRMYHSDSLYSAVSSAMARLGMLEEWLDATARAAGTGGALQLLLSVSGETLFVVPPRTVAAAGVVEGALEGRAIRAAERGRSLLERQAALRRRLGGRWRQRVPGSARARRGRSALRCDPARRSIAAAQASRRIRRACLEFAPDAGLWLAAAFSNDEAREHWTRSA